MAEDEMFTMKDIYFAMCDIQTEINRMNIDTKIRLTAIETELNYINKKIESVCGRQTECDKEVKELQSFKNRVYGIAAVISGVITVVGGVAVKFILDHLNMS